MKKIYFILIVAVLIGSGYFFARIIDGSSSVVINNIQEPSQVAEIKKIEPLPPQPAPIVQEPIVEKLIKQEVPFTVQAPLGNWSDPIFQNACEEASMIMAMGWTGSEKIIAPNDAIAQIKKIVAFENKTFGYSTDTNAFDMEKIFQQYFKYSNVEVKENITLDDMKNEIQKEKILIVPAYGRALKNPNFTAPGPVAHMLVVIGYDPSTKQFITNDPGTRKGAGYKYDEKVLFDAIWEYPSGKSDPPLPTVGKMQKAMIVISRD